MNFSSEHNIPWDLILSSLQKNIGIEEDRQLQQWISSSEENRKLFDQLKQTWTEDIMDYNAYRLADENTAWAALRMKLENKDSLENGNGRIIQRDFKTKRIHIMRWIAAAVVVGLITGTFMWYNRIKNNIVYQTSNNEEQAILLADGSSIKLYSDSRIEITRGYNKSKRIIVFQKGEAFFEVKHNERVPFIVDMGTAFVKDIGTSFYIHNTKDSIRLSVKSGEVAFTNKRNNDTRELLAGMSLQYQLETKSSTATILIDSSEATANKNQLRFENTPLSGVIIQFQDVYGKKIVLMDSAISQERFTANLEGQSFEEAIEILCKSLGIKYFAENDVYYLKKE